jgi:hypothetical protein
MQAYSDAAGFIQGTPPRAATTLRESLGSGDIIGPGGDPMSDTVEIYGKDT